MLRITIAIVACAACAACAKDNLPVQIGSAAGSAVGAVSAADPGPASLTTLPLVDLVGYLTGNYHTSSNNPAMYLDRDRKLFVMMGKHGKAELPSADPLAATAAFETFLLAHGYAVNHKAVTDDTHPRVMVGSQEMVVMTTDELFPEMPAELKAHFSPAQYEKLYKTATNQGMDIVATRAPVIWAYTHSLVVVGPGAKSQEFSVDRADAAFAAFRALAK